METTAVCSCYSQSSLLSSKYDPLFLLPSAMRPPCAPEDRMELEEPAKFFWQTVPAMGGDAAGVAVAVMIWIRTTWILSKTWILHHLAVPSSAFVVAVSCRRTRLSSGREERRENLEHHVRKNVSGTRSSLIRPSIIGSYPQMQQSCLILIICSKFKRKEMNYRKCDFDFASDVRP